MVFACESQSKMQSENLLTRPSENSGNKKLKLNEFNWNKIVFDVMSFDRVCPCITSFSISKLKTKHTEEHNLHFREEKKTAKSCEMNVKMIAINVYFN